MASREEIQHEGFGIERLAFVLDAAVKIAAKKGPVEKAFRQDVADNAFDMAETLWDEACRRFPEQEEESECSIK